MAVPDSPARTPALPAELPVVPLRGSVVLPMAVSPLTVSRQVSVDAVNRALGGDRMVLFLLQKNTNDEPTPDDLRRIGTVAIIRQMAAGPSGLRLLVAGVARVQAEFMTRDGNLLKALVRPRPDDLDDLPAEVRQAMRFVPARTLDDVLAVALPPPAA